MFFSGKLPGIAGGDMKFQPMLPSQFRDKLLVAVRLRPAQAVIEMNNRENDAELVTQCNQQSQQRDRVDPTRNRNPNPVPSAQQFLTSDIG